MKLIVGGYYVTREGNTISVKIDPNTGEGDHYPLIGSNGIDYTPSGQYWREGRGSVHILDLIREATPDEVIAFEAGRDSVFPTVDDVVDAEFVPPEFEEVPHVGRDKTASEIEGGHRTYADLFDRDTGTQPPPADPPRRKTEYEIDRETKVATERSAVIRNLATAAMQIMLGIAAILFSASAYVA